jgi:hypothetical protein
MAWDRNKCSGVGKMPKKLLKDGYYFTKKNGVGTGGHGGTGVCPDCERVLSTHYITGVMVYHLEPAK